MIRVELRNEYGLGAPELYKKEAATGDDPKALLDGVAVSGLVGILRQLGDLAEFAAEVFHGLQEQVTMTSSRSHKLMSRVQRIEAALPSLEKAVLSQKSHLHFAYTAGSYWHPRIHCEKHHFIYSDLPRFVMDSYEECRGPPPLHLLDKFDPGGPGSCLKRYSDPTFFRRSSGRHDGVSVGKLPKDKKSRRNKKRRSRRKNGEVSRGASSVSYSDRTHLGAHVDGQTSPSRSLSAYGATTKPDLADQLNSLDLGNGSGYIYPVFHTQTDEQYPKESSSPSVKHYDGSLDYAFLTENGGVLCDSNKIPQDRTHFGPLVDGQTSPSRSLAAYGATIEPDLADQSNSFDSGNGSGYIGHVFHTQTGEQYSKESSSPSMKHHDGSLDYAFLTENGGVLYDCNKIPQECDGEGRFISHSVPNGLLEEQTDPVSSYVTRGEKADPVKPVLQESNHDEILETSPRNFELDSMEREDVNFDAVAFETVDQSAATQGYNHDSELGTTSTNLVSDITKREAADFEIADHRDFQLDNGTLNAQTTGDGQLEDIESETDNFMDALNTIESESETDVDYQIKGEGELYSDLNKKSRDDEMDGIHLQLCDSHASNFDDEMDGSRLQLCDLHALNFDDETDGNCLQLCDLYASNFDDKRDDLQLSDSHISNFDDEMDGSHLQLCDSHASNFELDAAIRSSSFQEKLEYNINPEEPKPHLVPDHNFDTATSINKSNLVCSEHPAHLQSPEMATSHLNVQNPPDADSCRSSDVHGGSSVEVLVGNSSSSTCREQSSVGVPSDKVTCSPPESHKPPPEPSVMTSAQFWTNGGLLGLEPSKPPDFSVLNATGQVSAATRNETADQHGQDSDLVQQSSQDVPHTSSSNCSTSYQDDEEGGFSRWKIARRLPSADLDVRHQKFSDYHTGGDISRNNGFGNASLTSGDFSVIPNDVQTKVSESDGKSSFRMFEVGNRLLVNGFHRKQSFDRNENPNFTSSLDTGNYEQKSQQSIAFRTFSGRSKDFSRGGSPIMSPSSSPPLGHMKISFQPIDGFESTKLELKFPNGNNGDENTTDIFPSFQLVPEPNIPLHDIDSNSDEDTFCRSSPCSSDDRLSQQSESNSELWESGESPAIKDNELYDALCRISLTESISTSLGTGGTAQGDIHNHSDLQISFAKNDAGHSQSAHFFDLPSLDTVNPLFNQDLSDSSNRKSLLKSFSLKEPTPPPPPLPPMQWRGTKPPLDVAEDKQHFVLESPDYAFDLKLSKSTISQQPKPAPLWQDQIVEAADMLESKDVGRSLSVQKETNQAAHGKVADEKEDFLHQIRTKSFNLRRTVTTKPTSQTGLPTSVKVTAILEKANAIRQAVGSDDGDDDMNWSDN